MIVPPQATLGEEHQIPDATGPPFAICAAGATAAISPSVVRVSAASSSVIILMPVRRAEEAGWMTPP